MPTKKQPKKATVSRVAVKMAPFGVTVKKKPGGFTMQFDGVARGKKAPVHVLLEFPTWWAAYLAFVTRKAGLG